MSKTDWPRDPNCGQILSRRETPYVNAVLKNPCIFVDVAQQWSVRDRDTLVQEEMERKLHYIQTMQLLFQELDVNASGRYSKLSTSNYPHQYRQHNKLNKSMLKTQKVNKINTCKKLKNDNIFLFPKMSTNQYLE